MTSLVKRLSGMLFYLSISEIILKALDMLKKDVCHRSRLHWPTVFHLKTLDFQLTQEELWISCWQTGLDVLIFSMVNAMKGGIWQCFTALNIPPKSHPATLKRVRPTGTTPAPTASSVQKQHIVNNMRIVCLELPQSPMAPRGTGEHRRSLWLVSLGWQTCGQSVVLDGNKEQHITVLICQQQPQHIWYWQ